MTQEIVSVKIKKNGNQTVVILDSGVTFDVHIDLVLKYALSKGIKLSADLIVQILADNQLIEAKRRAFNYASYSLRTEKQITDKLKLLGYNNETISSTLEFLKKFDLIDDNLFAAQFIKSKLKTKAPSKMKLSMLLQSKGIDKFTIEVAIEKYYPQDDTFAIALKSAEKKLRMLSKKSADKQKNSLITYLAGQGFEWDVIRKVVEKLTKPNDE